MPLQKTVNIVFDRVYNQKLMNNDRSNKMNVLTKLTLDTCQKTAFTFNNIIYEQKYGLSMEASLRPVLANIINTEFGKVIADNLVKEGTIKFYIRYVDDTLLVERQNIDKLLKAFNGFDKKL